MDINREFQLSEERRIALLNRVDEQRSAFMISLYVNGGGAALLTIPSILDLFWLMDQTRSRKEGSIFFLWVLLIVVFAILFCKGFRKTFGRSSDFDCIRRKAFFCGTFRVSQKEPESKKPPFYVQDEMGNRYAVLRFLDYKHCTVKEQMLGVYLDNGSRYALPLTEEASEQW